MKIFRLGLLIILAGAGAVQGDIAMVIEENKTVWPIENREIEMVSEKVLITYRIEENLFYADCQFVLRNSSIYPQDLTVGFPDEKDFWKTAEKGEYVSALRDFRVWVDGQETQPEIKMGVKSPKESRRQEIVFQDGAYVWKMNFKGWQTRTVRTTYACRGYGNDYGSRGVGYALKTGRLWKGPIVKADIIVAGLPGQSLAGTPKGYVCKGDTISWHFMFFEPNTDIFADAIVGDYFWYHHAEQMLQKKTLNPDSLFLSLLQFYDGKDAYHSTYYVRKGSKIPKQQLNKAKDGLLARMDEGPGKDCFLYQDCLEKGDTAQAVTRWISSLQAKWLGRNRWEPYGPWTCGLSWETERFRAGPRRVNWENLTGVRLPPSTYDAKDAALNPDTGRYARCLKAEEAFLLQADFHPDKALREWEMLAGKYRSVGQFQDADRCSLKAVEEKSRQRRERKEAQKAGGR